MHELFLTLGFGMVSAAILSLSAVAFTLEYAVTNVAHLSHGEILTVGAYAAYVVHQSTGNIVLSALAAAAAGGLIALAMQTLVVNRFVRSRAGTMATFIATLGMAFIIQNTLVIIFGAANVAYTIPQGAPMQVGPFLWTSTEIEIILSALAITAVLLVLITHPKFCQTLPPRLSNRGFGPVTPVKFGVLRGAHRVSGALLAGQVC